MSSQQQQQQKAMLMASLKFMPIASDAVASLKDVNVQQAAQTPSYYPQAPPAAYYVPKSMKREETLFYIFYYQQGTPQQLWAAEELKAKFWRFHVGLKMWMQRHPRELPSEITPEWEKGTYIVWDHEQWAQKTRTDYKMEYSQLA